MLAISPLVSKYIVMLEDFKTADLIPPSPAGAIILSFIDAPLALRSVDALLDCEVFMPRTRHVSWLVGSFRAIGFLAALTNVEGRR